MWSLITAMILLCALMLFIIATWSKYSVRDIVLLVINILSIIFVIVGMCLFSNAQLEHKKDRDHLYQFYKNELRINRQEIVQETMEAYYENRIQETATVVNGVTKHVEYAICPAADLYTKQSH